MPMYDFQCKSCGHNFETIARLDEVPACPACKAADTERLMSAPKTPGNFEVHYDSGMRAHGRPKGGPGRS